MAAFVMFKWYELLHFKEILAIYWMTLVGKMITQWFTDVGKSWHIHYF